MSKKLILALVGVVFLSSFNLARAEVIINEIQLSPTGERFLELYNTGDEVVDLLGWYMQRKIATGSSFSSLVSKTNFEGKTIHARDYFVISRNSISSSDIVFSTLTLTESNTIQIKNTEGEIVDSVCWGDGCSDAINPTDGKSIQKIGNSWIIATPTPGIANQISSGSSNDEEESDTSGNDNVNEEENTSSSTTSKIPPKLQKPKVQIISKKIAHVGVPFLLEGTGTGTEGEKLSRGRYYWNFGDGDFRETKVTNTEKFTHTYFYPGEYTILFEYYPDSFTDVPDATAEIVVEVIEPKILISRVGNVNDFFIEMTNETGHDADISNWVLLSNYRVFTFPKNTNMSSNRKMIISPRISGFNIEDKSTLKLMTAEREVVFDYSSPASRQGLAVKNKSAPRPNLPESSVVSALENLPALALGNNISKQEIGDSKSSLITPLISFVFIGASAYAVYFIRRRKVVTEKGEDFEILDE